MKCNSTRALGHLKDKCNDHMQELIHGIRKTLLTRYLHGRSKIDGSATAEEELILWAS